MVFGIPHGNSNINVRFVAKNMDQFQCIVINVINIILQKEKYIKEYIMPAITPHGRNALYLLTIRDTLRRKYDRNVTWNEVLTYMFTELKRIPTLEARITALETQYESEKDHHTEFAETIALKLAERPNAPVMMQANPTMQQATLTPPPPPPKAITPPRPIQQLSGDVKRDYQREVKGLLTGAPVKPSEIEKINGLERKVVEAEEVPFLEEKPKAFYEVKHND